MYVRGGLLPQHWQRGAHAAQTLTEHGPLCNRAKLMATPLHKQGVTCQALTHQSKHTHIHCVLKQIWQLELWEYAIAI